MTELQKMQAIAGVFAIMWIIASWCYIRIRDDYRQEESRARFLEKIADERLDQLREKRAAITARDGEIAAWKRKVEELSREQDRLCQASDVATVREQSRIQALEHFSKAAVEIAEAALLLMDGGPDHAFAESMRESLDKIKAGDPVAAAEVLAESDTKYPPRPDTKAHEPVAHYYRS